MSSSTFLRRSVLMMIAIAVATGLTVYLLNTWFNGTFLPSIGISQPLGNAFGAMLVVVASFFGVRAVSLAFFRDQAFGQGQKLEDLSHLRDRNEQVIREIAKELRSVPAFSGASQAARLGGTDWKRQQYRRTPRQSTVVSGSTARRRSLQRVRRAGAELEVGSNNQKLITRRAHRIPHSRGA